MVGSNSIIQNRETANENNASDIRPRGGFVDGNCLHHHP
jgi:hypothetical protein